MADMMFALGQTKKKKSEETKVRQTKTSLKDVNITDTIEKSVRSEQHQREQKWKATGRNQIKKNTNFDMARSLFGGGGPPPKRQEEEDEEEYVQEKMSQVRVADDDDEEDEEERYVVEEEEVVEDDESEVEVSEPEDDEDDDDDDEDDR